MRASRRVESARLVWGLVVLLGLSGDGLAQAPGPADEPGSAAAEPSDSDLAMVFGRGRLGRICPCPRYQPYLVPEEAAVPEAPAPPEKGPPAVPPEEFAPPGLPSPTALARGGPMEGMPNMIGDFFSVAGFFIDLRTRRPMVSIPMAGGDRRFKIAEENSPIPTDRAFFNYNMFHNALLGADGRPYNFNRYVFGLEKTFFDERTSVELRIPFGNGLNSVQSFEAAAAPPVVATEFGNIPLVFKGLLWSSQRQAFSAGVAVVFPTGRDGRFLDQLGHESFRMDNEAVHLQPFVGWVWTPRQRLFFQLFTQVDFDTAGNPVFSAYDGGRLQWIGRFQDQNLFLMDTKVGFWLYRNPEARLLTGLIPTVELHYTSTIHDSDTVGPISNPFNRLDFLNITGGLHFQLGSRSILTVAAAAPLRTGESAPFDSEVGMQFERRF